MTRREYKTDYSAERSSDVNLKCSGSQKQFNLLLTFDIQYLLLFFSF